jgi:hypothetical protein
MTGMGLEPTIRVFEWAKAFRALDHTATLVDLFHTHLRKFSSSRLRIQKIVMNFSISLYLLTHR